MAAWRGCCPSLGRCLWSSKISQPPDPALQTPGASQGCKRWAAAGVGSKRHASGRLTVEAEHGSPALLPILSSLPNGGHQLLGLPRWDYASQKGRRSPVSSLWYLAATWTGQIHSTKKYQFFVLSPPHPSPPSLLCIETGLWFSFVTSGLLG